MQHFNNPTMLLSALAPLIIFSVAGIHLVSAMFLEKLGRSKWVAAKNNSVEDVINQHFQSFVSKDVYLTAKGKRIKTKIIKEGISLYTLFNNDRPVISISKGSYGWVVSKDYTPSAEYKLLTLPFIMYVEQVLYN